MAPESSYSGSQVPVSSRGVKRGRAAPDSGPPADKRRKNTSPSPYVGWSGTGQENRGSLPLRIVTQVRTVLDYVKGTARRPCNWMRSFPLIHGGDSGPGELILLIVPPETKAKASHKTQPQPEPESEGEDSEGGVYSHLRHGYELQLHLNCLLASIHAFGPAVLVVPVAGGG